MTYRVPLAYNTLQEAEISAAEAVLRGGRLTQGEMVERFEEALAQSQGVAHAIVVNSGSSANLIAIEALIFCGRLRPDVTHGPLQAGDEVIIQGLSWPTTLKPVLNHGLRPVFCDINLNTLNADVASVDAVRTSRTRAVIAVPVLGNPEGLDELKEYCERNRLILVEDACESLGAVTRSGRGVGTLGIVSALSFYFSHHITTVEGGAILTDCAELADLCFALRSHGWTRHFKLNRFGFDVKDIDPRFCFVLPGYNVRATEIAAAIGIAQLARFPKMLTARRQIAKARIEAIRAVGTAINVPGADILELHSWMTFPMMMRNRRHRQRAQEILESAGIETRPIIVGNVLRHPLAKMIGVKETQPSLPHCDAVFDRGLMIGLNPLSTDEDEEYLHLVLRAVAAEGSHSKCASD